MRKPLLHALMELLLTIGCHLCCAMPATMQRCMVVIFSDYVENIMAIFMDDLSVYRGTFDLHLDSLAKVLLRCEEVNLVLNWEKLHFMVQEGVVLVSRDRSY